MGLYTDRILPRVTDVLLGAPPIEEIRARVCDGLSGDVLEVGFGSGRNLAHYPAGVDRVRAVEPADGARRLADPRIDRHPNPVELVGRDGAALTLDDDEVDHVVVTWTLCTIPDVESALTEMRRVLRPGGRLHFAEHGRSGDDGTATWQARITPVWKHLAGGCHLDRPIDRLIEDAGFTVETLRTYVMGRPAVASFMYEGVAVN